jgi:hypothetical protein
VDLFTLLKSAGLTAEVLRKWSRGDEVGNLFDALDREFGDTPGLSAAGLAPLRGNEEFLRALFLFWHTRQFDREAMVTALEPTVGRTAELTERQLAEKLGDAINLLSPRAQATGQDLFGIELVRQQLSDLAEDVKSRDLRGEVAPHLSRPLPATGWASALARDRLQRLIAAEPDLVAPLVQALAGLNDPRTTIVGLIADPPQWLADGHHRTWSAVGETAD